MWQEEGILTKSTKYNAMPEIEMVTDSKGRQFPWQGFYTGSKRLTEEELFTAASLLLGMGKSDIASSARHFLKPFRETGSRRAQALIVHGATPTTMGFEGDVHDLINGRHVYDCATYLETRSVYLARSGDICVGRTLPWLDAVSTAGLDRIDLGQRDYYYLSQQLIVMALNRRTQEDVALDQIIAVVRSNPELVVRLYALDTEMQVFLLWLMKEAGLASLNIDANGPEISDRWNQKAPLHPTVSRAISVGTRSLLRDVLDAESAESRLALELGIQIPVLPGYTIERPDSDRKTFVEQSLAAARLLVERYDIRLGCLKPSEAGDGARIVAPLDLSDSPAVAAAATEAFRHGDDYLLEPFVDYQRFWLGDQSFIIAPSSHIRYGDVAPGLTLQMMKGVTWTGNIFIDEMTSPEFGIRTGIVGEIRQAMEKLLFGFNGASANPVRAPLGLVTAGVDFAVGRIGGKFGDDIIVAAQDLNLSSHGAEYLRSFLDHTRIEKGLPADIAVYGATRVVRPSRQASLHTIGKFAHSINLEQVESRVISIVPGRWAMIASQGATPRQAALAVIDFENDLLEAGHVV